MKKYIKLIVESLFNDNIIYSDNDNILIDKIYKKFDLTSAKVGDVVYYSDFYDSYNLDKEGKPIGIVYYCKGNIIKILYPKFLGESLDLLYVKNNFINHIMRVKGINIDNIKTLKEIEQKILSELNKINKNKFNFLLPSETDFQCILSINFRSTLALSDKFEFGTTFTNEDNENEYFETYSSFFVNNNGKIELIYPKYLNYDGPYDILQQKFNDKIFNSNYIKELLTTDDLMTLFDLTQEQADNFVPVKGVPMLAIMEINLNNLNESLFDETDDDILSDNITIIDKLNILKQINKLKNNKYNLTNYDSLNISTNFYSYIEADKICNNICNAIKSVHSIIKDIYYEISNIIDNNIHVFFYTESRKRTGLVKIFYMEVKDNIINNIKTWFEPYMLCTATNFLLKINLSFFDIFFKYGFIIKHIDITLDFSNVYIKKFIFYSSNDLTLTTEFISKLPYVSISEDSSNNIEVILQTGILKLNEKTIICLFDYFKNFNKNVKTFSRSIMDHILNDKIVDILLKYTTNNNIIIFDSNLKGIDFMQDIILGKVKTYIIDNKKGNNINVQIKVTIYGEKFSLLCFVDYKDTFNIPRHCTLSYIVTKTGDIKQIQ